MKIITQLSKADEELLQKHFLANLQNRLGKISFEFALHYTDDGFDALKNHFLFNMSGMLGIIVGDVFFEYNSETRDSFHLAFVMARNNSWLSYIHQLKNALVNYGDVTCLVTTENQMKELFDVLTVVELTELKNESFDEALKRLDVPQYDVKRIFGFIFNGSNGIVCFSKDWNDGI